MVIPDTCGIISPLATHFNYRKPAKHHEKNILLTELKDSGLPCSNRGKFHRRVLLVDGDRIQCALHAAMLALAGFATCSVPNSAEALEALDVVRFDVVLTENVIPGLGGRGLVHAMRAMGDHTAVVVISGRGHDESSPSLPPDEIVEEVPRTASSRELISAVYRGLHADPSWHGVAGAAGEYTPHSLS